MMSPSSAEVERRWLQAGQSALAEGDRLAEDDFDGACRRFLIAAYCFARAWCPSRWPRRSSRVPVCVSLGAARGRAAAA